MGARAPPLITRLDERLDAWAGCRPKELTHYLWVKLRSFREPCKGGDAQARAATQFVAVAAVFGDAAARCSGPKPSAGAALALAWGLGWVQAVV